MQVLGNSELLTLYNSFDRLPFVAVLIIKAFRRAQSSNIKNKGASSSRLSTSNAPKLEVLKVLKDPRFSSKLQAVIA